ncbi:MAG: MerR family DNA-binding transcriptional regulator [bacterium]
MKEEKIRIGKAAEMIGVTVQTLRNWEKSGKLRAQRSAGGQRYYDLRDIQRFMLDIEALGWVWAASAQAPEIADEYYCERHDRFLSRLEKMSVVLLKELGNDAEDLVSLLIQIAGEIGDNSFAHNIGNWPDVPGIFFTYNVDKRIIVLADRGRGILKTLRYVRPSLDSDIDALRVAFTEIVSGRSPEERGNGLKVVRRVTELNMIGLSLRSGLGVVRIPKSPGSMGISMAEENVRGVYAVITF